MAIAHATSAQSPELTGTNAPPNPLAPITVIGERPRPAADVAPLAPGALDVRGTWSATALNTLARKCAWNQLTKLRPGTGGGKLAAAYGRFAFSAFISLASGRVLITSPFSSQPLRASPAPSRR